MTLRVQMLLVAFVPFIALIGFGSVKALENWASLNMTQLSRQQTKTAIAVTELVHALQVERGQSAAFLTSKGEVFAHELEITRQDVDAALALVPEGELVALTELDRLKDVRASVQTQTTDVPTMAKFYIGSIGALLEEVSVSLLHQDSSSLSQIGGGLVALSYAKEAAGLQRAAGATGFGQGSFATPAFKMFFETGANEAELLKLAQLSLGTHFGVLDLDVSKTVPELVSTRSAVLATGVGGDLPSMTSSEWFELSTRWISHLHDVGIQVKNELGAFAAREADSAKQSLVITGLVVLGALLCSVLFAQFLTTSLTRQFSALQNDLDKLGQKEFDFEPQHQNAKNEIGSLCRSIEVTRVALQEAEEKLVAIEVNRVSDRGAVIGVLETQLERLSKQELNCEISEPFPEEYERLRVSFNESVGVLKHTIQDVRNAAGGIRHGANEISQTAGEMSERTESQAATLEQAAAALEEMTSSVRAAADSANEVDGTVQLARREANKSESIVQNAIGAMSEIEKSSSEITHITGVIDDIAFQTNLLALNAGVEAARAGEAGKGFAVVAAEVQGLAQRSADAATQVKKLISDSTSEVQRGATLVGEAGDAIGAIVGKINEISKLVSEIAAGASEQANGLAEINTGVLHLDTVTQRNAAMAEQTTASGQALNGEATKLAEMMDSFVLEDPRFLSEQEERLAG